MCWWKPLPQPLLRSNKGVGDAIFGFQIDRESRVTFLILGIVSVTGMLLVLLGVSGVLGTGDLADISIKLGVASVPAGLLLTFVAAKAGLYANREKALDTQ